MTASEGATNATTLLPGGPLTSDSTTYSDKSSSEFSNDSPTALPASTSFPDVTSTMTSAPSEVSLQSLAEVPQTTNGWAAATASDGSPTLLPFIVPCVNCAPMGIWIGVTFSWLKFPKLPSFHLPCIRVIGVHVSGDCLNPETDGPPPEGDTPTTPPTTETTAKSTSHRLLCYWGDNYNYIVEYYLDAQVAIAPVGNAWHRRAAAPDPMKFRAAETVSSLGSAGKGCGLDRMTPAAKPVTVPGYPRGSGMYSYDVEGALVGTSDVLRYVTKDNSGNENRLEAVFNSLPSEQWMGGFALMTKYMNTSAKKFFSDIPTLKKTVDKRLSPNFAVTGKTPVEDAVNKVQSKTEILQKMSIGCMTIFYDPVMQRIKDTWKRIYLALLDVDKVVSCNGFEASGDDGSDATGSGDNFESDVAPLSVAKRFLAYTERLFNDEDHGINPQGRTLVQRMIEATARDIDTLKSNDKYIKLSEEDKGKSGLEEQEAILKMIKDLGDTSDPDNTNWGIYFDASALANEANNEAEAAGAAGSEDGDSTGKRVEKREACALPPRGPSGSATASRMKTQASVSTSHSNSGSTAFPLTSSSNGTAGTSTSSAKSGATSPTASASSLDSISASSTNSTNATSSTTSALSSPAVTSGASITSCALTRLAQSDFEGHTGSATLYCDCNDGRTAGLTSTIGVDLSTTYNCAVGNETTIGVSTVPPPAITSCALVDSSDVTTLGSSFSASQHCSCNDGLQADLGSTVGSDDSTTFTCDVGTQTTMAMSTAPPSTSAAPTTEPATTTSSAVSTTEPATTTSDVPEPTESCHTQYKVFYDTFSIYGHDWDAVKLDGDGGEGSGSGLHHELSGCADVTKWKFESIDPTEDSPFTFHASGHITIWQKSCIEHAISSAGAPDGHCSGSG
ncbi:hypothetical protein KC338_g6818 [Hortaea werneckii]|nr:hypothetical protein KC338_g6818 [Hortaea werneckii]